MKKQTLWYGMALLFTKHKQVIKIIKGTREGIHMVWLGVSIFSGFSGRQATSSGSLSLSPETKVVYMLIDLFYMHKFYKREVPSVQIYVKRRR